MGNDWRIELLGPRLLFRVAWEPQDFTGDGRVDTIDYNIFAASQATVPAITSLAAIQSLINAAYSSGAWAGQGITSSGAANSGSKTAIGYAEQLPSMSGASGMSVDTTSVVARYADALHSDIDGNGFIDSIDFNIIAASQAS